MNPPLTSIIMPMHNELAYSKLAVESLYRNTNREEFELICIDDASTDGTSEYLDGLEGVKVIHFKENVGFDHGVNAGIKLATGEYTAVLNNDLLLTPYWLSQLIAVLESDPHIGIVVPACNSSSNYQVIPAPYTNSQELEEFARKHNHTDPMRWQERVRLIFYTALFRTRELKAFGGLDEQFSPGGFEDDDLSLRYRRAGYRLIFATDTYIHHYGSISMSKTAKELLNKNRLKFFMKHQIDTWDLAEINIPEVYAYDFPKKNNLRVLGVGSRAGATQQYLKSMYMEKCRLVPVIDYLCKDQKYLVDAMTICNHAVLYDNRDDFIKEQGILYDVIMLEDILCTDDLTSIMKEYKLWLKTEGDLILLLPKGEVIYEETDEYRLRYQRELGTIQFCVFARK